MVCAVLALVSIVYPKLPYKTLPSYTEASLTTTSFLNSVAQFLKRKWGAILGVNRQTNRLGLKLTFLSDLSGSVYTLPPLQ